jgi:hypothetical protein
MQSIFINELGNEITLTTTDINPAPTGTYSEIGISIEGPRSLSEWIITIGEARELCSQLCRILASSTSP